MVKARKLLLLPGERKTARATAAIYPGAGRVRINGVPAELWQPEAAKEVLMTPLQLASEHRDKVDIEVTVHGGGFMGQATAAAMAVARALVGYFKSPELEKRILEYDDHLLKGDARQAEPKKFGGPGARRRRQKSYR